MIDVNKLPKDEARFVERSSDSSEKITGETEDEKYERQMAMHRRIKAAQEQD